jgi:integrase
MPLTSASLKNANPKNKTYRLYDSGGLYLEIAPSGGKWWRLKYRFDGKEKRISLGTYPATGLKKARQRRDLAKEQIEDKVDPSVNRKATKTLREDQLANSFEAITCEWYYKFKPTWSDSHAKRIIRRFERDIFPWLGKSPINDITPRILLKTLRKIEDRGALETAHRALQSSSQVFRYAIATGRAERDPCSNLRGAIPPAKTKHHAAIFSPKAIGELLRAIDQLNGSPIVKAAMRMAPLLFVRPGELRNAEWSEIDFDKAEWRIPAKKMKLKQQHIVPLSHQVIDILNEIYPITNCSNYIFPSVRNYSRAMSDNTLNVALRRLGYTKDQMTAHGFRSIASTLLNEQGWNRDAIERQLAHAERSSVRSAYNYAEYLPERKKMMQSWADYLDQLRLGAKVLPINSAAS